MSLGLLRLISWDRVDGYFMRGSFASGGKWNDDFANGMQ